MGPLDVRGERVSTNFVESSAQSPGAEQSSTFCRLTMAPSRITIEDRIENLLEFEEENGHMFVPKNYKEKDGLGRFVSNARQNRKNGSIKPEMIAKLDEVGFVWVVPKGPAKDELVEWGKQFRWLVNFHKTKGHCNVPSKIGGKDVPAAAWCDEQRQLHLNGKLDKGKFDKLSKLDFDFYGSSEDNEDQPTSKRQRTKDAEIEALRKENQGLKEENKTLKAKYGVA